MQPLILWVGVLTRSVTFTLLASSAFSQGKEIKSDYYANLSPKTPSASSLGAFGNTKVNYYTGFPEIALDLMTLQGRDLSLPVTLNYDASGIRVDELSGMTGIKWNLNAGGYIERSLKNLPDEAENVGYWKHAKETNYFKNVVHTDWVQWNERNDYDCSPDDFLMVINGRSIRFVFDKDRVPQVVPRQNVKINFFMGEKTYGYRTRIDKFEITLEDGVKYIFGGSFHTVAERKVETLMVSAIQRFRWLDTCPERDADPQLSPMADMAFDCSNSLFQSFEDHALTHTKTIDFHNYKWYLSRIVYPTGEAIDFAYANLGSTSYNLRPTITSINPMKKSLSFFSRNQTICFSEIFGECIDSRKMLQHFYNLPVTSKFDKLSKDPPYPGTSEPIGTFDPNNYPPSPGASNFHHTLITEQTTRLLSITSSKGNRITFETSARTDLPNTMKYDVIKLYNMTNQLVKAVKLNYADLHAKTDNDYLWYPEGLIMKEFSYLGETGPFYAEDVRERPTSDIPNKTLVKFVYEGVKDHNYRRMYLTSLVDVTDTNFKDTLYQFSYSDWQNFRRRTTTYHDIFGFGITKCPQSFFEFKPLQKAAISHAGISDGPIPLAGMLSRITYPSKSYTDFRFVFNRGIKLQLVRDFDEQNRQVRAKEIEYTEVVVTGSTMERTTTEFYIPSEAAYARYSIFSSSPQNDAFTLTHGAISGCKKAFVYYGTKSDNLGFERYIFSSVRDAPYTDVQHDVQSIPPEPAEERKTNIFPYPPATVRDYVRGLLLRHDVYKKGSSESSPPVSSTRFEYKINPNNYKPVPIVGYKGGSFNWKSDSPTWLWFGYEVDAERKYRHATFDILPEWIVLDRKIQTTYDDVDSLKNLNLIEEYVYDNKFLQQTELRKYVSTNPQSKLVRKTKYVTHLDYDGRLNCESELNTCTTYCDYSGGGQECHIRCVQKYNDCLNYVNYPDAGAIYALRNNNQVNSPVEIQTFLEESASSKLISSVLYRYTKVGTAGVHPKEVWECNQPMVPSEFKTSYTSSSGEFFKDAKLRKVHTFDAYDEYGNLTRQTTNDGTRIDFAWAHNGSLLSSQTINPGVLQQRKTYVHKPLVGLTSSTDENGVITKFDYDVYGRLVKSSPSNAMPALTYFYHKAIDAFKESLTASLKVTGPPVVGEKIRFETPLELRQSGEITYSWEFGTMVPHQTNVNYVDHVYSTPGNYVVTVTKKHPEFGTASASQAITIAAMRKVKVCIDGPYFVDVPDNLTPTLYGQCTTQSSTTTLSATYEGACGLTTAFTYRWQLLGSNGVWELMGTSATVPAPALFVKRTIGLYKIRCIITDSCGYQTTSDTITLTIQ
jgi:hypothetical protein